VKARLTYLLELNKKQTGHNIQTRIHDLYDLYESTNQCSDTDRQRFQNIAKQMYTNAKQAEEQCKSTGSFAWSSMLAAAGLAVQLANQELRKLLQGNASTTSDTSRSSAIARAKHNRDECYEMLYTIQEQANTLRETDIELRIEEEATKNNPPKEAILKAILRREREAEIFPLLLIHVGGKTHNQLDEVWTPNNPQCLDDTTWKSHIKAEAIWEALLSHGKEHFSQASNTPFVSGPIAKFLGPHEWNKVSEQLLAGTFDIDSITDDVDVQDIVKAMSHHNPANPLTSDSRLTIEKLKEGFKRVKETTSSNPEGLHHGHWKALTYDEEAFEPFALMIMFAFQWGEPPKVWANSLQICLPKDEPHMPITRINRIQCIQLVCAALNMGFRIIWGHEMMQRAIKAGHVSDYQFGGRSGYMYISAILLKRLSYDICRQMQLTAAIFNNDATVAYDRMIPSQCMILSAREGVNVEAIETHRVLRENEYRVKSLSSRCLPKLLQVYDQPPNPWPTTRQRCSQHHVDNAIYPCADCPIPPIPTSPFLYPPD
jgi:hypothetical protein